MFQFLGVFFLLLGAVGFSYSICRDYKARLSLLKDMKEMYRLLQSEICYTSLPLPEIFRTIGTRCKEPISRVLLSVSDSMTFGFEEEFSEIWTREMQKGLEQTLLTKQQKELLFILPESIGMNESKGQAEALRKYIEELDRCILQMEEEEKSRNKVIMSLGIAAGLFMVIILL